ncbi:undecaprenyl-diphosphatase [Brevibacillus composti]|uniref:Undecaprenyl-diphosphatase n=1 Tax=Brevibacillus composti TaxID=2796470 RepID=A0A7T5EJQ2_9BACL|nr:undecaprenyl-diphosphatase [Brevibacillus composti]QQE73838.1 undecaprenyl-diphosphatase [Brevibacillus composti]QUO40923.1 undecaprenyl-diphosphatase [Brevibacillus composti]
MSFSQVHEEVFRSINDLGKHYPALNPFAVFLAEYTLYVLAAGVVVYWFTRSSPNRRMVVQAVLAFGLAEIYGTIAGQFYSHHQPFAVLPDVTALVPHEIDNSFPSDHTILFFSFCFSFLLVRGREGWLWLALAVCVGISRIYVGVHYPVDIAVGALFGMLAALIAYRLTPKLSFLNRLLAVYEKIENRLLPSKGNARNM